MRYQVTAVKAGRYWELHIAGEGVTQCRDISEAPAMVRDWLETTYERSFADCVIDLKVPARSIVGKSAHTRVTDGKARQLVKS